MSETKKNLPIRILHIVGGMNTGGVETWLMHVLRKIDREQYKFDFLVHTDKPCFYDNEIRPLGCQIIPCLRPHSLFRFLWNFYRILKNKGPYDVIHSHVHHFSGFTLMLSHWAGVPIRIAHSHNDTSLHERRAGFWRKCYLRTTKWLIRRHATSGLACSRVAAINLFGKDWESDPRWQLLYCGIDIDPFKNNINKTEIRKELGMPLDTFVIGHVGRFSEQKNHDFLLEIFAEVVRREPKACLLLVGDGPLRGGIEQKVQLLGLSDKVIFAGVRPDVPRLLLGAMDVFVFPSRYEGLPLVLVESQAAGLPAVISDVITGEGIIDSNLVKPLSLQSDSKAWAKAVVDSAGSRQPVGVSLQRVSQSRFNAADGVVELSAVYSKEK